MMPAKLTYFSWGGFIMACNERSASQLMMDYKSRQMRFWYFVYPKPQAPLMPGGGGGFRLMYK